MIDELLARNYKPAAYTSASRFDQPSLARSEDLTSGNDPNFDKARRIESTYNVRWAPAAGGNAPAVQKDAATTARSQDIMGPFKYDTTIAENGKKYAFNVPPIPQTNPQYTSSGADGDALKLHVGAQGTKFRAILFGGSTAVDFGPALKLGVLADDYRKDYLVGGWLVNYNTLERTHARLLAAGYTEDEMWIMYPGGEVRDAKGKPTGKLYPDGPTIPDWVDAGTRYNDLTSAWGTWLKGQTDANTQVLYWNSWGHGNTLDDAKAQEDAKSQKIPKLGTGFTFEMDPDLASTMLNVFNYYKNGQAAPPDGANPMPYFEVETSLFAPQLSISLDGTPLPLLDALSDPASPGGYCYRFGLSEQSLMQLLAPTQQVSVNYDFQGTDNGDYDQYADFITLMGPTAGNFANGPGLAFQTPEPASVVLLLIGGVYLKMCSRKRARRCLTRPIER